LKPITKYFIINQPNTNKFSVTLTLELNKYIHTDSRIGLTADNVYPVKRPCGAEVSDSIGYKLQIDTI